MTDQTRFEIERYLAGEMTAEAASSFLGSLKGDPEALALLGRLLMQQALLFDLQRAREGRSAAQGAARTTVSLRPRSASLRRAARPVGAPALPWGVWVAAAACLAVAIGALLIVPGQSRRRPDPRVPAVETARVVEPAPETAPDAAAAVDAAGGLRDGGKTPEVRTAQTAPAAAGAVAEGGGPKPFEEAGRVSPTPLPVETAPAVASAPAGTAPPAEGRPSAAAPAGSAPSAGAKEGGTNAALARVERVRGEVQVFTDAGPRPAQAGDEVFAGQEMRTGGGESLAVIVYGEQTRLEAGAETSLRLMAGGEAAPGRPAGGKRVHLERGTLAASVTRQPTGRPMVFTTPHAEATVLGTRLTLTVGPDSTRLVVSEGRVRFARAGGGPSVDVWAGHTAVAAPGTSLASKPVASPPRALLAEDFADPRAVEARWQPYRGALPTLFRDGFLEIDLSPRSGVDYSKEWAGGGLRSRSSFQFPVRVSATVHVTHRHENVNVMMTWVPAGKGDDRSNHLTARLRGEEYTLMADDDRLATLERPGRWPRSERWTFEADRESLRFLVDGEEILRSAHGRRLSGECVLELRGLAKDDVPEGARARFDDVRVEPVER